MKIRKENEDGEDIKQQVGIEKYEYSDEIMHYEKEIDKEKTQIKKVSKDQSKKHNINRNLRENLQEKLDNYEDQFKKIYQVTGINDIQELQNTFINAQEHN